MVKSIISRYEVVELFFTDEDLQFKIVSVLNLSWKGRNAKAMNRPFHAISFRISGDAEFLHEKGSVFVKSKDLLFVPKNFDYIQKAKEEELIVVHLTCESKLPSEIMKFTTENPQYFERKFKELYSAWMKQQPGYKYECSSIFYKIIMAIERELANKKFHTDNRIADAIDYIHDNFITREISVEFLANMCGMSDTYFRRLFVEKTSMTPIKYIRSLKLNYAIELLKSGYYNIREIADKCGFSTVNYFSLFIKKETGFSPNVLRKKLLEQYEGTIP